MTVVADAGVTPTGTVTIFDGTHQIQTVELGADGTATVTLSGLSRGVHLIGARFEGTGQLEPSRSGPDVLLVL